MLYNTMPSQKEKNKLTWHTKPGIHCLWEIGLNVDIPPMEEPAALPVPEPVSPFPSSAREPSEDVVASPPSLAGGLAMLNHWLMSKSSFAVVTTGAGEAVEAPTVVVATLVQSAPV